MPDWGIEFDLTKAQVPVDMAHEPCVATRYPGRYLVMLTELYLKRVQQPLYPRSSMVI